MNKKDSNMFKKTVAGMVFTVLFPWIAGFISALADINEPFFAQTAFSHAVVCLLFSLPLCLAMLYMFYHSFVCSFSAHEKVEQANAEEKTA